MGCASSVPTHTTTIVRQVPHVTRAYVPTVVVPQQPIPTVVIPQQQIVVAQQPSRQPVTKEIIVRFVFLSQSIAKLERRNIMGLYQTTMKKKRDLETEMIELRQRCEKLESDIQNSPHLNKDAATNLFGLSASAQDSEISSEEKAFEEAWINLDITKSQLDQMTTRLKQLTEQSLMVKKESDEYIRFCEEQDKILENAFGGIYGSELEDELEDKLESLVKKQQYIRSYLDRCRRGENMFGAANQQLASAAQRWEHFIMKMPISTSYQYNMVRQKGILDIRSSLISAHQNLINAQQSLSYGPGALNLPYCSPKELGFLSNAINGILYDASVQQRQRNAFQFYLHMANRASVLRDALSKINVRIQSDLKQVGGESAEVQRQLRMERVGLMKDIAKEAGVEVEIDVLEEVDPAEDDVSLVDADVSVPEKAEDAEKLEKTLEEAKAQITEDEVIAAVATDGVKDEETTKTPLDELAPAPTKNELIGNLDTIMAAYEEQMKTMQREQESAKAKQEARIKEKLRKKKSEQMRALQMEE